MRMVRPLSAIARVTAWRNPPRRVRRELVAAAVVELLDRADQPERALLDQVEEREPAAQVALRDRHDEPQVGLDHVLLGRHVAALDALRERDLLLRRQQRDAPDGAQVQTQRVQARLDREVDLRLLGRHGGPRGVRLAGLGLRLDARGLRGRGAAVRAHDVDPLFGQVAVELLQLLLGDLDLFQRAGDLLEGQEPSLLRLRNKWTKFVQLVDRCLIREQHLDLDGSAPLRFRPDAVSSNHSDLRILRPVPTSASHTRPAASSCAQAHGRQVLHRFRRPQGGRTRPSGYPRGP